MCDEKISLTEHRPLIKKPDNILKQNAQFEKYISDHLPFRDLAMELYFKTGILTNNTYGRTLIGKDQWLFMSSASSTMNLSSLESYQNKKAHGWPIWL